MKRCISILLFLIVLLAPVAAGAVPSPLTRVSSSAAIFEDSTAQVISYKAYLKVESNITTTKATLIIKNNSPDTQTNLLMGMPASFEQNTIKLSNLTVTVDGQNQYLVNRKNRTNLEDTVITDIPNNWSAWTVNLQPNEHKVIDIVYTTENQTTADGTKSVYIPLEYLKAWQGNAQNIELTVDIESGAPYGFEPNPSVLPQEYDKKGRLTWIYKNTETPNYIRFYYRNINQLAGDYIKAQAPSDRTIDSIVNAFASRSYETVINQIDEYISTQSGTPLNNELLFIKALSHQELYQFDSMADLYNQLEGQPLFGELEGTMKNKIIYDRYYYMKEKAADEATLYEYLDSSRNYVMGNALFLKWMEEELSTLTPPPTPSPEPTPTPEPSPAVDETITDSDDKLVKSITIGDIEIPVEYVFLAVIIIIIIFSLIIRRKKRYKNRGYMFR